MISVLRMKQTRQWRCISAASGCVRAFKPLKEEVNPHQQVVLERREREKKKQLKAEKIPLGSNHI